ncbi:unnamed protein product [Prorocentrum cordatum]|uniref:Uncharacterized protein n=2 Tax=Prorocentrum cordatum TaxID=2364126 RepID=A0ABN9SWY5_9DINO|nr:unnamed protein product [Polarella glacialis]
MPGNKVKVATIGGQTKNISLQSKHRSVAPLCTRDVDQNVPARIHQIEPLPMNVLQVGITSGRRHRGRGEGRWERGHHAAPNWNHLHERIPVNCGCIAQFAPTVKTHRLQRPVVLQDHRVMTTYCNSNSPTWNLLQELIPADLGSIAQLTIIVLTHRVHRPVVLQDHRVRVTCCNSDSPTWNHLHELIPVKIGSIAQLAMTVPTHRVHRPVVLQDHREIITCCSSNHPTWNRLHELMPVNCGSVAQLAISGVSHPVHRPSARIFCSDLKGMSRLQLVGQALLSSKNKRMHGETRS